MKTLVYDDFQAWPIGPFPSEYSAIGEYHYDPSKGRMNQWYESTDWHGWRKQEGISGSRSGSKHKKPTPERRGPGGEFSISAEDSAYAHGRG